MAKIDRVQDLPEWFHLTKYDACQHFGAAQWYVQLQFRREMLVCNPWFPDEWVDDGTDEIRHNAEIWRHRMATMAPGLRVDPILCSKWEEEDLAAQTEQPISELTYYDLKTIVRRESYRSKRSGHKTLADHLLADTPGLPLEIASQRVALTHLHPVVTTKVALLADLGASDATLEASFRKWLKRVRANQRSSSKRGSLLYARWASYGVLPYLDLLMWAMETDTHVPRHVMSEAVSRYSKGESAFSKTVVPLAAELMRDLSGLRALAAVEAASAVQAEGEAEHFES